MDRTHSDHELVFVHDGVPTRTNVQTFVALTPESFDVLERADLGPVVVDDLGSRPPLLREFTDYYRWKHSWFRRLDEVARAGDGIVRLAAQVFNTPLDSVVAWARLLDMAVATSGATAVRYVGATVDDSSSANEWHAGHLQFHPLLGDAPLASTLLPLICASRALPITIERAARSSVETRPPARRRVRQVLAQRVGPQRGRWPHLGHAAARGTLMLWHSGYGADRYADEQRAEGRSAYFLTRGGTSTRVLEPHRLSPRIASRSVRVLPQRWSQIAPSEVPFLDEVDEWAGVAGAGRLLESRMAAFLQGICGRIDTAATALGPALERRGVDRIAAANPSSIEEFAALEWGKRRPVERVLCQHGDHLFSYDAWLLTETQNFDVLRTSDRTLEDELPRLAAIYDVHCPRVELGSPRVDDLVRRRLPRPSADGPVVYVPGFLVGDSYVMGGGYIEDGWYHRWHRQLLALMAARADIAFLWKGLPASDQSVDPIAGWIDAVPNVSYRTDQFLHVAAQAGRVVTDFASTVLYECVALGLPVLALHFTRFADVRPAAAAAFAPVLRECDDEQQAMAAISQFLTDDADAWILDAERIIAAPRPASQ